MSTFNESAKGVYLITVTPFASDGALDLDSTDRMVDSYLERGVDGLTRLGIMGEAPKLTHAEAVALTRQVVRRVNGLPVIVGASAPGFAQMEALA
ncbi:MAG: dihydrodipicolinate synthase family protein, partial [Geminicoccaceae bacterium]